jgi:DNA-binding GntR family transcriptional regulator
MDSAIVTHERAALAHTGLRLSSGGRASKQRTRELRMGPATYEAIREDIVTLSLAPGEKVSEIDLERRYRVGKAPVRVALGRLAQEGLVINRLRSGHIVAPITLQDITETWQLRRTLESEAAALAAGHVSEDLTAAYERTRVADFDGSNTKAVFEFLSANRDFIVEMARCTGNKLMIQWICHLEVLAMRTLFLGIRTQRSATEWRIEYEEIYGALARGDAASARKLVCEAVAHSERVVLDSLMQAPDLRTVNLGAAAAR